MAMDLKDAQEALRLVFGHDDFREGQKPVVESILTGANVLAVMPTGAGKSLCFQIPALMLDGLTVVVSPLVALMEDQVAALRLSGVAADTINSSRDRDVNVDAWRRVASGETRLLYISPERLMTDRMIGALQRLDPSMFAIDEAHCISRWGAAFRPEYERLSALGRAFPNARLSAFTATADPATREDICAKLFGADPRVFVSGFDRPNITPSSEPRTRWQDQVLNFVKARPEHSGIIYALSRKNVGEIAEFLNENGFTALPYHAGMDAEQRRLHQDRFMTERPIVMVATIAFGMGIDKPDIRYVLHTHLPSNIEAYYQEIGRAGRDGAPAEAHMLFGLDDVRLRRRFIDGESSDSDIKRREHKRLDALVAYAEASSCRRVMLLAYFGDRAEPCGNCDLCLNPPVLVDATGPARIALAAVQSTGERFGAAHLIDVLRGSENQKVVEFRHHKLPVHGDGASQPKPWWQGFFRQLVSSGHLEIDIEGYGGLRLTPSGREVLSGSASFECREIQTRKPAVASRPKAAVPELSPENAALMDQLKAHRLELARERSVPPYVIFHDRTLIAMAETRPANREAFLDLPGVGKAKADQFAESFLGVLGGSHGR
ncbi:MAG: DNA helicase RecQ [Pseudomonadota bacterium]